VFQDETGFSLHPRLSRGWGKIGQRLRILTTSQHRERLNISGWVAPLLGRYGMIKTQRGDRQGFLDVIRHLYRRLKGHTIWLYVDGARWHKGELIDQFIHKHSRLHIEYLPPYQPGLNMQERIWRRVRYESTANCWFDNLDATWFSVQRTTCAWSPQKIKRLCNLT
jgi:transposase